MLIVHIFDFSSDVRYHQTKPKIIVLKIGTHCVHVSTGLRWLNNVYCDNHRWCNRQENIKKYYLTTKYYLATKYDNIKILGTTIK